VPVLKFEALLIIFVFAWNEAKKEKDFWGIRRKKLKRGILPDTRSALSSTWPFCLRLKLLKYSSECYRI
jgi:hypothetical protein